MPLITSRGLYNGNNISSSTSITNRGHGDDIDPSILNDIAALQSDYLLLSGYTYTEIPLLKDRVVALEAAVGTDATVVYQKEEW